MCECCGFRPATEAHHCLIHRARGIESLDDERNIELVCSVCHPLCNAFAHRDAFWQIQVKRYGKESMEEWLDSLPLKVKPKFD